MRYHPKFTRDVPELFVRAWSRSVQRDNANAGGAVLFNALGGQGCSCCGFANAAGTYQGQRATGFQDCGFTRVGG